MVKLTQKQENFTQNILLGMSQHDAYLQAGYSSNYAPAIVDTNACNLAKSNKVLIRLEELRAKTETDNVLTVIQRKELLSKFAVEDNPTDRGSINRNPNISSLAELNKMTGAYPPEKHAIIQDTTIRFIIGQGYDKPEGEE